MLDVGMVDVSLQNKLERTTCLPRRNGKILIKVGGCAGDDVMGL